MALICNLTEINWFAATNFHNQDVDYLENYNPETMWTGWWQEIFTITSGSLKPCKIFSSKLN